MFFVYGQTVWKTSNSVNGFHDNSIVDYSITFLHCSVYNRPFWFVLHSRRRFRSLVFVIVIVFVLTAVG